MFPRIISAETGSNELVCRRFFPYITAMGKLMDIVCICKNIVFFLAIDSQKFAGNHIMLRRIQINLKFHLRRKILL